MRQPIVCIGGSKDGVRVLTDGRTHISFTVPPPPLSLMDIDRNPLLRAFRLEDYRLHLYRIGEKTVPAYVLIGLDPESPFVKDRVRESAEQENTEQRKAGVP